MKLLGYDDIYSFDGSFCLTMLTIKQNNIVALKDIYNSVSMDNVVDRIESYENIVVNIEDEDNLKDIFVYKLNMVEKTKASVLGVNNAVYNTKIKLNITYFDKEFEKHIPFLIKKYKEDIEKDKNIITDVNLVFEYAPNNDIFINEDEFKEILKEDYATPDEVINNMIDGLKQ